MSLYDDEDEQNKTVKLYKKRQDDGVVVVKDLRPSMFGSMDDFNQALDFYYEEGFHDTYNQAKESPQPAKPALKPR